MAKTLTQSACGTYTGTAAAITIHTGFKPKHVVLIDQTQQGRLEHIQGMPDASGFKSLTGAPATTTFITTNGITLTNDGFVIGTDAGVNTASDAGFWYAVE